MDTLVIATTQAKAKEAFLEMGLEGQDGSMCIGIGGGLYGNRFDKIVFAEEFIMNSRTWDWLTREFLCRIRPGGEVVWAHQ
jgi:hypothetical protein